MSYEKLIIYTDSDYEGRFNLKKHEKELILISVIKASGDKERMARMLGITLRTLYNKIIQHGLEEQLKIYEKKN